MFFRKAKAEPATQIGALPELDPEAFEDLAADPTQTHRERLWVALSGFAYFELLYSAAQLDLFAYLKKKKKARLEAICSDLKLPRISARVLLQGCAYLGLVTTDGETFSATPLSDGFARQHPQSVWPVLNAYHSIIYPTMHKLPESLAQGTNVGLSVIPGQGDTLYERLESHPELEKVFHDWMYGLGRTVGLTDNVLKLLRPALRKVKHLVDYGGGDASNAITLCKFFPHLQVTVFDSASVCRLARANIEKAGLAGRIQLHEGNFLQDPFVPGVDAVMFNHIFNIYSGEKNTELLRKSRESLNDGGVAIVFNTVAHDTEDGPACAPMLSAYFLGLATGQGMVYPLKDYDAWFGTAGFGSLDKFELPEIDHGLVVARK